MALARVRQYIQGNLGRQITPRVKAELARLGLEQYSFKKYYILEWCEFVINDANATGTSGQLARKMTASFYRSLKNTIRRQGTVPFHLTMNANGMIVTQLSRRSPGFQKSGSTANKMIRDAKRAAIKRLEEFKAQDLDNRTEMMSDLHGHHAGVTPGGEQGKRSTGAVLKAKRDTQNQVSPAGSIEDLMDEYDQRTPNEALYDVVVTQLSNWIDIQLGFDKEPQEVLSANKSTRQGKKVNFQMSNIIYIEFALGSRSNAGREYTQAMREWDGGRAGQFGRQIDIALEQIEKKITREIENNILKKSYDLIALRGSPSIEDHILAAVPSHILNKLVRTKTGQIDKRVKVNKQALADYPKLSKVSAQGLNIAIVGKAATKKRKPVKQQTGPAKHMASTSHPLALKEMINAVLPDEILKNMGSPALNNRTGRFRESAQVTNALVGPKGGINIEYTYQRNPYETFEPGGAQGSTGRDPRRLIGNTIREVAQEIMGKKFIRTRRV